MGTMANQAPAEVIEATGTSTPAQGQGNRDQRRKAEAAAARKAKADAKKAAAAASTEDTDSDDTVETVVVPSKPAKAAFALGRGLRKVGRGVIDTDLRDVGHGVKRLKRFVPVVSVEKRSDTPSE
jgi:hypothetical protein